MSAAHKRRQGARPVDGYLPGDTEPGDTIRWGSWQNSPTEEYSVPFTLFPYASGSDYSGNLVEVSNYRVLQENEHVMSRSVLIQGGHGTYGIAYLGEPTDKILELVASLESHPLLDELHHSKLESETEQREWADWGRKDFHCELEKEFSIDELQQEVTDEELNLTWRCFAKNHGEGGRVFEQGEYCHFYIDHAIKWLHEERVFGTLLVLGNVKWSDRHDFAVARDAALEGRMEECHRILNTFNQIRVIELEAEDEEPSRDD